MLAIKFLGVRVLNIGRAAQNTATHGHCAKLQLV